VFGLLRAAGTAASVFWKEKPNRCWVLAGMGDAANHSRLNSKEETDFLMSCLLSSTFLCSSWIKWWSS